MPSFRNKSAFFGSLFFTTSFGVFTYITPYISILNFKSALENDNYGKANQYIDFPSVRQSLKIQIKENVNRAYATEIRTYPYASFGLVLLEPIVNRIVDMTVTANGLKLLLDKGLLANSETQVVNEGSINTHNNSADIDVSHEKVLKPKINLYYYNFNTFILSSTVDRAHKPIISYWKRDGIFHWRLNSLSLPHELLRIN